MNITNVHPCEDYCHSTRVEAQCVCPPDRSNSFCQDLRNLEIKVDSFTASTTNKSQTEYLNRKDPFAEYALNLYQYKNEDITITFNMSCKNNIAKKSGFEYFVDTPSVCNLK